MVTNRQKNVLLSICAFLIAVLTFAYVYYIHSQPENQTFYDQLGVSPEAVDEVILRYHDQDVIMGQRSTEDFLETLKLSKPTVIADQHEFTPSDIEVIFKSGQREYPVTFYWFPYHTPNGLTSGNGSIHFDYTSKEQAEFLNPGQRIGDRFDVMIGSATFHYRFQTEKVWTEELMRSVYDQSAAEQSLRRMAVLDGGDVGYLQQGLYTDQTYSIEEILSQSDLVLLATFERTIWCQDMAKYLFSDQDQFHVDEVLKGNLTDEWYMFPSNTLWECYIDGFDQIQIAYQPAYAPLYEKGKQYLICFDADGGDGYFGQYGSAVLDGDLLFPRYNTEDHPFYNVSLQTVRELLNP